MENTLAPAHLIKYSPWTIIHNPQRRCIRRWNLYEYFRRENSAVFNEAFAILWRTEVFHIVQSLSTARQCDTRWNASLNVRTRRVFLHPHNAQGGIISIVSKQSLTIGNYVVPTVYFSSRKFWEFVIYSALFCVSQLFFVCSQVILLFNVLAFQELVCR